MAKTRMAGKLMGMLGDFVRPTLMDPEKGRITPMSVAGRIAPDAFFGALAAAHTPGDAFDKGAAFLGSTVGGSMGAGALQISVEIWLDKCLVTLSAAVRTWRWAVKGKQRGNVWVSSNKRNTLLN